jgi:hypothetical protein
MVTQQTTNEFDPNRVRKTMIVEASPALQAIVEPRVGGRW